MRFLRDTSVRSPEERPSQRRRQEVGGDGAADDEEKEVLRMRTARHRSRAYPEEMASIFGYARAVRQIESRRCRTAVAKETRFAAAATRPSLALTLVIAVVR